MRTTTEQKAYQHLRRKLVMGLLPPGSRVSAVATGKEMGLSAPPVAHAIRRLENEGLIELVPHLGTFVKRPDPREIEELYELRLALESFAVAKAVGRLSSRDLAELERVCQSLEESRQQCVALGEDP